MSKVSKAAGEASLRLLFPFFCLLFFLLKVLPHPRQITFEVKGDFAIFQLHSRLPAFRLLSISSWTSLNSSAVMIGGWVPSA